MTSLTQVIFSKFCSLWRLVDYLKMDILGLLKTYESNFLVKGYKIGLKIAKSQRRTHFRSRNNCVCNFWSWTIEHKRQLASSTTGIADNWFYETMKIFFVLAGNRTRDTKILFYKCNPSLYQVSYSGLLIIVSKF